VEAFILLDRRNSTVEVEGELSEIPILVQTLHGGTDFR
jgi:hypothetical protein